MSNAFLHDRRGSMHAARMARIFAARDGKCHSCGKKLRPGDSYEIDHVIALATGGTDDDDNLAPICTGCHLLKTKGDISTAAKIKRQAVKHTVPQEYRRHKSWRR